MALQGLIADIGGTNARFALSDGESVTQEKVLKCEGFATLVDATQAYLSQVGNENAHPRKAAFAIAGPVTGDRFAMTNNPWSFSIEETRQQLGLDQFRLLNDFEAVALSVPHLIAGTDYHPVGKGKPHHQKPIGIIGPGTGLGVASLMWDGKSYRAVAGEGGHVTMPAVTQREFDLFEIIKAHKGYSHVSAERVCSGKGLANIYYALRALDKRTDLPEERLPEEISAAAMNKSCDLCVEALDLMTAFLGRIAGNLAVTIGAHGGIFIAGGIISQLGKHFDEQRFREQFVSKGRYRDYLEAIPTFVITNKFPAFVGLRACLES